MDRYRMRGMAVDIQVEAYQLTSESIATLVPWCNGEQVQLEDPMVPADQPTVRIVTGDGERIAHEGDYVAKSDLGDFFVYDEQMFTGLFEKVQTQ